MTLQHLDLSHNQLSGPLAYSTWPDVQLPALQYLDLSANQFSDDVPWWPHLTALQHIDLSQNAFFGPLPWQLDQLVNLRYVALHSNHLSGPIWSGWSQIGANVTYTPTGATPPPGIYLDFSGNHLWGPLPAELGLNPAIMGLQLSGNQLSGAVPAAITDRAFYRLDLNYNLLTSPDPNWPDRRTQTRPPTDLRATIDAGVITLSWTPPTYISYNSDYEISYAPAPTGPFTVAGYPGDARRVDYRLPDLAAEATYYFRLRTIAYPQSYYENGSGWDAVCEHAYFQPNTLWSDYTPVVCVNCAPPAPRLWLPLLGNAGG